MVELKKNNAIQNYQYSAIAKFMLIMNILLIPFALVSCYKKDRISKIDEIPKYRFDLASKYGKAEIITNVSDPQYYISADDTLELYYYQGFLKQISTLKNGEYHGTYLEFDEWGTLRCQGNSYFGSGEGICRTYGSDGSLIEITCLSIGHTFCELQY